MRLKHHYQPPSLPTTTHCLNGCRHFPRMVSVVIHQHGLAALGRKFALDFETSPDAGKLLEARNDRLVGNFFVAGDSDGRRRVEHIVGARGISYNFV